MILRILSINATVISTDVLHEKTKGEENVLSEIHRSRFHYRRLR